MTTIEGSRKIVDKNWVILVDTVYIKSCMGKLFKVIEWHEGVAVTLT